MLIAVIKKRGAIDRRSFLIANEISEHRPGLPAISEADLHSVVAQQALLMQLDPEAALKALPRLLPSETDRERAVAIVARIMMLEPALSDPDSPMAKMLQKYLDLDPELAHDPVPGRARGDVMSGEYLENRTFEEILERDAARAPIHHLVELEDIGAVAAFLVGDWAKSLTGSTTYVDADTTSSASRGSPAASASAETWALRRERSHPWTTSRTGPSTRSRSAIRRA